MRLHKVLLRSILLFIGLSVSAVAYGQTLPDEVVLSYACRNKPLKAVLKDLDQKSGVRINFVENRIPGNAKVSITAKKQQLGIILKAVLNGRRCKYEIVGNQIVISRIRKSDVPRTPTISGYLTDKESGESLVGANVYLLDKTHGTQTNEYGFYSLTLEKGTKRIYYSYLGYAQEIREVYLDVDTTANIQLVPDALLNEVIILDDVENQEEPQTYSESKLHLDRIRTASSLGGEADVIRLVGMMPGVSSGADGLGGINVRGGSADQNLILYDGVPVYNAGHAFGIFSVFNSNVIKNATLIKGNIPARYGGRLSSVLDVRTREGNNQRFAGDITISALAAKGTIEGPLGKNGSSFLFSARRTFLDPWIKALTKYQYDIIDEEGFSTYHFSDFNGKLSLKLNDKNSLYIGAFYGRDNFHNENQKEDRDEDLFLRTESGNDWNWGNELLSVKLTTQFSKKTFGRLLGYYSKFDFESFEFDSFRSEDSMNINRIYKAGFFSSAIQDIGVKYDLDYIPNTTHTFRLGIGAVQHNFSPGLVSVNNLDNIFGVNDPITETAVKIQIQEPKIIGYEYNGFIEDEISFGYGTTFNAGLHVNYTITDGQTYMSYQPRAALLSKWNNAFFKIGVSRMNQYMHLLSSNGLGLPTDVWLPSTSNIAPEKSWIGTAGVGYFTKSGFRAGAEVYYKLFDDLTTYNEGGLEPISVESNWDEILPIGTGEAYGIEFNFDKIIGRTTWNSNYTLAFSNREFEKLNQGGEPFSFRYNRRHSIKLGFLHKITDNTEFTMNWNLMSGNPITAPNGEVISVETPNGPELIIVYTEKNTDLLPTYHRLDFGFNFYNNQKWGRTKLFLGLYNTFNKSNPFYIDIENTVENPNRYQKIQYSILPLVPSIGYSVSF